MKASLRGLALSIERGIQGPSLLVEKLKTIRKPLLPEARKGSMALILLGQP